MILRKIGLLVAVLCGYLHAIPEKPMVIIVPSYNNARWLKANLDSIFSQNYSNYRVIYIDDCSTDNTYGLVKAYINEHHLQRRVTLVHNDRRRGAMENLYNAIWSCADREIIVTVDGDDSLNGREVLNYLNRVYSTENVWLTYGQYVEYPGGQKGFCAAFPDYVIKQNSFRTYGSPVSHLRTFYTWLFKKIRKQDLLYGGQFFPMTWDKAMLLPMLVMFGGKFKFISDILYIYNAANPINDHKVDGAFQTHLRQVIERMPAYQPLRPHEIPAY